MHRRLWVVFATVSLLSAPAAPAAADLKLGQTMPPFQLPGTDGKTHTDKDYADARVLVLLFTCNHCPTAQAYEDRIIQLDADYRGRGVKLVAISPNNAEAVRLDELGYTDLGDSLEDMKLRAKHRGFKFPYLYDGENQKFSRAVGVKATPHVFIFDSERKLRYNGRIDNSEVGEVTSHDTRNAIEDLLAGREVKTPTTRIFGCSTKWLEKKDGVAKADEAWAKLEVTLGDIDAAAVKKLARNDTENYVLVNIWATWCGPCVAEFDELVTMQRMYARRHFKLVTISLDLPGDLEKRARVEKFLKEKQAAQMANYIYSESDKDKLAEALDPQWPGPVPHTVLIAPGGKVVYRKTGAFDAMEVKKAIADHLGRTYASRKK